MDKKEQLVALWKTCFGDSDSFIRLFFDRVYRDENALTLERDGRLCCALHIVPYKMPSSVELADATLKELDDYDVVMWEKHGVFAVGTDVMDAFDQIDVLTKAAQIYINARCMGFEPDGMTKEQMQELTDVFHLPK